jgi:hypothetical protein
MANCMLFAQELDLQGIFNKIPSFHFWIHVKTNDAHQNQEPCSCKELSAILEKLFITNSVNLALQVWINYLNAMVLTRHCCS